MLSGFEVVEADRAGGSFTGAPWRAVLHTTEGSSVDGAVGAYRSHGGWPHFTIDCAKRRRVQHYELDVSARALANLSGGTETNKDNAIQFELVGFAIETPDWSKDWLRWLATDVLAPVRVVCPFALAGANFIAYPDSYGLHAPQRFDVGRWDGFSGICGHQHVPENDHGDPGAIDVNTILAALGPAPVNGANRVNTIASDPVSGETQIFDLQADGNVRARNIKKGSPWYGLGALPAGAGKAVSIDASQRRDGTLDVSVKTDKGVIWINGAPAGKPFQGWYVP